MRKDQRYAAFFIRNPFYVFCQEIEKSIAQKMKAEKSEEYINKVEN